MGTGNWAGCFSTHDRELLSTGEGEFVLTDDEELAECIDHYTHLGHLGHRGHLSARRQLQSSPSRSPLCDVVSSLVQPNVLPPSSNGNPSIPVRPSCVIEGPARLSKGSWGGGRRRGRSGP